MELQGAVAVVTGATGGLGQRICRALAVQGVHIAGVYQQSAEAANALVAEWSALGPRSAAFQADVTDHTSVQQMVQHVLAAFGRIDVLVNDAGVNVRKPALELSEDEWDLVVDTNLKGYFLVAQAVGAHMVGRRSGKVINVSSIFGAVGMNNQLAYASSKGGVVQLTKVLAIEWAPHVHVNAIAPTYFETPLVASLRNDPERFRFINERTPMGRWGQPEELEGTLVWLASRASDFVTGQTVYVDGGWTIW